MPSLDTAESLHYEGACFSDGAHLPTMVSIRAGSFVMGADVAIDRFASAVEQPAHVVNIAHNFALAASPVTFEEWDAYSAATAARRPNDRSTGRGKNPVVDVSWTDATGYVSWLSSINGRKYRLPSEAEWEYCCRAGTIDIFSTGSRITVEQANFLFTDFRKKPGIGRPVEVGSYPANAFGLFDMHGNVCQFVADAWHNDYRGAPIDGSTWDDPGGRSPWRVVRGSGWDAMTRIVRCAFRDWHHREQRFDNTGFRVACDIE